MIDLKDKIDPSLRRLISIINTQAPSRDSADVEGRRFGLERLSSLVNSPANLYKVEDYTLDDQMRLRLYVPRARDNLTPGTLYFHGGGWVAGSLDTHDCLCRRIAEVSDRIVVAVDYRLAPEHPFPTALDDAWQALTFIATNGQKFGIDTDQLALAGDSAGGTLAAALCLRALAQNGPTIDRLMLICPILDLAGQTVSREDFANGYFVDREWLDADIAFYCPDPTLRLTGEVSPLRAPSLAGFPPTHIHIAEFDPFRDEAIEFSDRLKAEDVPVDVTMHEGMIHYFYNLPGTQNQVRVIAEGLAHRRDSR